MIPKVKFMGEMCSLRFAPYSNGRTAMTLMCEDGTEPMASATVNVPEIHLRLDEVLVRDYSETSGMLEALTRAGVVKATGRLVPSGFVTLPVAQLLVHPDPESGRCA